MNSAGVKALLSAGVAFVVAMGVTACGAAEELSAKDTVDKAVHEVSQARTGSFVISLDSTVADLQKLEAAEGGKTTASSTDLQRLLDGDVTIAMSAPEDSTLSDLAKAQQGSGDLMALLDDPAALEMYLKTQGSTAIAVRLKNSALIELRSVGTTIYARADVAKVLILADQDPSLVDSYVGQLPPSLAPVAKAAEGEWLAIDLVEASKSLKSAGLLDQFAKQDLPTSADPAAITSLLESLRTAYDQNARIVTASEDGERGTQYRVTAPAKQVAEAISDDLAALAGPDSAKDVQAAIAEVPERDIAVDLWVKDDQLRGVSIGLAQFAEKPVDAKAALDIQIDIDGDEVAAPEGANTLDVSEALLGLGGAMNGMGT